MPTVLSTAPGAYATTITVDPTFEPTLAIDQLFVAGIFQKGPVAAQRVFNMEQLERYTGLRVANSVAYDACRMFLQAGRVLTLGRIVGPAPVKATTILQNSTPANLLGVDALYFGAYGNAITIQVIAGTVNVSARILIVADALGERERTPEYTTQAQFVTWGAASRYVRIRPLAGTGAPVVSAATALVGGTDDAANITDTQRQAALDLFGDTRLGPGQVCMPGSTSAAAYALLLAHADAHDHHALLDMQDVAGAATAVGAVLTLHTTAGAGRSSAYWPWCTLDGYAVPPCAAVAAVMARSDVATANPNQAAAGDNGSLVNLVDSLTQTASEAQRAALNDAGVNVLWDTDGQGAFQVFGIRTLTTPDTDALNLLVPNVRLDMLIRAEAKRIGRRYNFKQIDGQKHLAALFGAELISMMRAHYNQDALYGATEAEAFRVETLSINNALTAAARQVLARIYVKRSSAAEQTLIEIFNFDLTVVL